jgi:hypothetical protein
MDTIEKVADAIDAARFAHPTHPRERDRPFADADRSDREYAMRLTRAAIAAYRQALEAEGMVLVPKAAIDWLNGEGDSFERPEGARGNFWWRSEFRRRAMIAASPSATTTET